MAPARRVNYFAFGSNMHISQMATRCPSSVFLGSAILENHRFQINERGVANVVPSAADCVEGLVFSVNNEDQNSLDKYEGVKRGLYERQRLKVRLRRIKQPIGLQNPIQGPDNGAVPALAMSQIMARMSSEDMVVETLTYVSPRYCRDGPVRQEYVQRMRGATKDAVLLGISRPYVERCVAPIVEGPTMEPEALALIQAPQRGRPASNPARLSRATSKQPRLNNANTAPPPERVDQTLVATTRQSRLNNAKTAPPSERNIYQTQDVATEQTAFDTVVIAPRERNGQLQSRAQSARGDMPAGTRAGPTTPTRSPVPTPRSPRSNRQQRHSTRRISSQRQPDFVPTPSQYLLGLLVTAALGR